MTRQLEDVDIKDNNFKVFVTNKTVESLIDSEPYEIGEEYYVTIGKMTCGKINLYYANAHTQGANKSYRVYDTVEELKKEFNIL